MTKSKLVAARHQGVAFTRGSRSIGVILVDAERLKIVDIERILAFQKEQGLRFGDAATRLGSVVIGFDRHAQFQHTFTFDTRRNPTALTIQTLWDRKNAGAFNETPLLSERLVIFEHPEIEGALRAWAHLVAQSSPIPPRQSEPIIGWCSWYNLYGYIDEENILAHLRGAEKIARQEKLPMRVFQIDDGFTPEMGDWLDVKPQFPRGMKPLLDDIRAAAGRIKLAACCTG